MDSLSPEEKKQKLKDWFKKVEVDAAVVGHTLGVHASNLTPELLLTASTKLIKINKLEQEPDDRDDIRFNTFHGIEDFVKEKVEKDDLKLQQKAKMKMQQKKNLSWLHAGYFTPQIKSIVVGGSQLSQNIEGHNPMDSYDISTKVTKLGPGGIPCHSHDTEVLTSTGWKAWPAVTNEDALACNIAGKLEFHRPINLYANTYSGKMFGATTTRIDYLVTPNHRLNVSHEVHLSKKKEYYWTSYYFRSAEEAHGKKLKHLIAVAPYDGGYTLDKDYVVLLAAYLADGYCHKNRPYIEIAKRQSKNPKEYAIIKNCLESLGISYKYSGDKRFMFTSDVWWEKLRVFGTSKFKYVPAEVLKADRTTRQLFLDTITTFDVSGVTGFSKLYASASKQLLEDVGYLAISLGYAVTYFKRENKKGVQYQVLIQNKKESLVSLQKKKDQYYVQNYDGVVYCAEVPGGMLFTRRNGKTFWSGNSVDAVPDASRQVSQSYFGFLDPFRVSESISVGVDHRFANGVIKGRDNKIYKLVYDKHGKLVWVDHETLANSKVELPEY